MVSKGHLLLTPAVYLICPPPISYENALSPNVIELETLGGNRIRLGHEAGGLLMELVAFKTEETGDRRDRRAVFLFLLFLSLQM